MSSQSSQYSYPTPLLKHARRRSQHWLSESFVYRSGQLSPFTQVDQVETLLGDTTPSAPLSFQPGI